MNSSRTGSPTDKCKTVFYLVGKDRGTSHLRDDRASEQRFWAGMCLGDVSPRATHECKLRKIA